MGTSFGVWPLHQAARTCFETDEGPAERPTPQVSLEFEVADADAVAAAAHGLEGRGFELLHGARTEPWGQTVARLLSNEGSIVGISYAPSLHTQVTKAPNWQWGAAAPGSRAEESAR